MELEAAWRLGRALMEQHGLHEWELVFDTAKRRAGATRSARRQISLSGPLTMLHPDDEVRDTLLHEIAHALVGPSHGHDEVWRRTATAIGCSGERCSSADMPSIPGEWLGTCRCGFETRRHRRPERVLLCARCESAPTAERVLSWSHRGRRPVMHPNFVAELAAIDGNERITRFGPGSMVRVVVPGPYFGMEGEVVQRRRTRYVVDLPQGRISVMFAGVEAVGAKTA